MFSGLVENSYVAMSYKQKGRKSSLGQAFNELPDIRYFSIETMYSDLPVVQETVAKIMKSSWAPSIIVRGSLPCQIGDDIKLGDMPLCSHLSDLLTITREAFEDTESTCNIRLLYQANLAHLMKAYADLTYAVRLALDCEP